MKKAYILVLTVIVFCLPGRVFAQAGNPKVDLSLAKEIDHSIKLGLKWLYDNQEDDGSWQHYPAMTALVLSSFMRAHPSITTAEPAIAAGYGFLATCARPNGSIYLDDMPNYNTVICLTAFKDAGDPAFDSLIRKAELYLMGLQIDESEDYSPDSLYYGGVGYGGDQRPDLSNLQWAIEAMALDDPQRIHPEEELTEDEQKHFQKKGLFYDKALVFLAKCQNLKAANPEAYAGNDGGFMYEPGASKAGGTSSYGSMTYAGLKSLIYAKVNENDPRVQAAHDWISKNFVVETTPKMGNQGLYYYYQTMAKALNAYGDEMITDPDGNTHRWRNELADQLLRIQSPEGFWVNENGRWWENNPVLVTAYTLLALEEIAGLPESTTSKKRSMLFK